MSDDAAPGNGGIGAIEPGTILAGRYRVLHKLGGGGMGVVYLAEHVKIGRKDAIKVLRTTLARDEEAVARFTRGARNVSAIHHPNVCTIYDFGELDQGSPFLAMEFISGESLRELLEREGALPFDRTVHILDQVADALEAAHAAGIVHRDLKPANVMITSARDGSDLVKVVDFDIAKGADVKQDLTQAGFAIGTPEYMSPEQLSGQPLDARSDVYSLALIVFRMLTGELPFRAKTSQELMMKRLTRDPLPLAEVAPDPSFPAGLQSALDRALAREVEDRTPGAEEFARAIADAIAGRGEPEPAEDIGDAPTLLAEAPHLTAETPDAAADTPDAPARTSDADIPATRAAAPGEVPDAGAPTDSPDLAQPPPTGATQDSDLVRRLAAVCFVDIVGYSRLTSENETAALRLVQLLQSTTRPLTDRFGGRIVKFVGDAVLISFPSTDAAVRTALQLEREFREGSEELGHPALVRAGLHVGEVVRAGDGDIYGDGVNLASRLHGAADPGRVLVSEDVWRQLRQRPEFGFQSLGQQQLKGMPAPIGVYHVELADGETAQRKTAAQRTTAAPSAQSRFGWKHAAAAVAAVVVLAAAAFAGRALLTDSPDAGPDADETVAQADADPASDPADAEGADAGEGGEPSDAGGGQPSDAGDRSDAGAEQPANTGGGQQTDAEAADPGGAAAPEREPEQPARPPGPEPQPAVGIPATPGAGGGSGIAIAPAEALGVLFRQLERFDPPPSASTLAGIRDTAEAVWREPDANTDAYALAAHLLGQVAFVRGDRSTCATWIERSLELKPDSRAARNLRDQCAR